MSSRRLFSSDPQSGINTYFHYDADTDRVTLQKEQDVEGLLEANEAAYNSYTSLDRWREWNRVASIPLATYFQLLQSGKLYDQKYMRSYLNSSEFRKFRTRPGKLSGRIGR